jgi:transglutaminase-like putative cysteine protease
MKIALSDNGMKGTAVIYILAILVGMGCLSQSEVTDKEALTVGEETYYAHSIDGKTIGYTHYTVTEKSRHENEEVFVVEAETVLTLEAAGAPWIMSYRTTGQYTDSFSPQYYSALIDVGGEEASIECQFSDAMVTEKFQSSGSSEEQQLSLKEPTYLLDSNVFHHYGFLFRTFTPQENMTKTVSLFNPQSLMTGDISIKFNGRETVQGRSCIRAEAVIFQQDHTFWATDEGELLALEIPSQNFRMERSDASITEIVESIEILDILSAPSNVSFPDPFAVEYLKIWVSTELGVGQVDEEFLSSPRQIFSGTVTDTSIDGVFEIRSTTFTGPGDPYLLSESEEYLMPEMNIESDDPAIKAKAEEITRDCTDSWEVAKAIAAWIHENITYRITGGGAKDAFETKEGDCGPHSYLTVAMLRSIGVPSRLVGGVMYGRVGVESRFVQHAWTEVFIDGEWVPIDSTTGQCEMVDATHIRFFRLGSIRNLEVEVLEYREKASETTAEKQELSLEIGESHSYRFIIGGEDVGRAGYTVRGGDPTGFLVDLTLEQNLTTISVPVIVDLEGTFSITEEGAPLLYRVDAVVSGEEQRIECTFSDGTAHVAVTAGEKTYEEEITLEADTYIMGNNIIGLWALVYRSIELEEGEVYTIPVFFPSNFMAVMVEIEVTSTDSIEVAGESYDCFVCKVPLFKEIDYVTEDGLLVRIEIPSQDAVIELE